MFGYFFYGKMKLKEYLCASSEIYEKYNDCESYKGNKINKDQLQLN